MTTGTKNRDGAFDLAGSTDPVSLRTAAAEPISIGSLAAVVISDLSVRLSGEFQLPRLVIGGFPGGQKPADR